MFSFSTDHLPAQERFDYWCEARAKYLFGVTIELDPERRKDFWGRFSSFGVGEAVFAEMSASSYRVSRTESDIVRVQSDSLCIGLQVKGPGWLDVGDDRIHRVEPGAFTVGYSDTPFAAIPDRSDGFHFRLLKIPLAGCPLGKPMHDLVVEPLAGDGRLTRLIKAMFDVLCVPPADSGASAELDVQHIARLAMMARGRLGVSSPEAREALHAGFLHAARAILDRNLHRPELSPLMVASSLGISVRQLHHLFEPTGMTFTRTLTLKRLHVARRMLVTEPHRPVIDIAYGCGFESAATFYRAFRVVHGMTPSDARAMAVES
ncbi:MAG: AraC family transcriptional regulator [Xanthobacteraceae bacterium]|nr:AraC family transcriptional regulator [Xanthobacteraceae bacterium]